MMVDLNEWVRDIVSEDLIDAFRVPVKNENGKRVVDFCDVRRCA